VPLVFSEKTKNKIIKINKKHKIAPRGHNLLQEKKTKMLLKGITKPKSLIYIYL
jgi:vacuolar-type H+-ATPase subunit D/Vma8